MKKEFEIRQDERAQIGRHLHDVIANELLHLQFLILKSENEINKESFTKITDELEFIRSQVRNISHNLSAPKAHNRTNFSQHLKEILLDYAFLFTDITFNYNVFPKNFSFEFETQKQQEVIIVLKELIQNSLQHGNPSVIEIGVTEFDSEINIMIEDNGKGFNLNSDFEGIGLDNCKKRIQKNNGSMTIDSSHKNGTTININLYK